MKSLLLVFCISAMVAAEALPAAAQEATTCTQRLALCNSRCGTTQVLPRAAANASRTMRLACRLVLSR